MNGSVYNQIAIFLGVCLLSPLAWKFIFSWIKSSASDRRISDERFKLQVKYPTIVEEILPQNDERLVELIRQEYLIPPNKVSKL